MFTSLLEEVVSHILWLKLFKKSFKEFLSNVLITLIHLVSGFRLIVFRVNNWA